MTRTILSTLAVVAMLATGATPAASQAGLSGQQPVPCDCIECSAEHCPKPGESQGLNLMKQIDVATPVYLKTTWERHLSSGSRNVPPPDCPPLDPIKDCLASWGLKTADPFMIK